MVLLPLLALLLGFILVYIPAGQLHTNEVVARYTAIAVLAGLDTLLGGLRAWWSDTFDETVFLTGFFANGLLAAGLVALGEQLGLETGFGEGRISVMMVAAVVVLSARIFNNLAALRRMIIERWRLGHTPATELSGTEAALASGAAAGAPPAGAAS